MSIRILGSVFSKAAAFKPFSTTKELTSVIVDKLVQTGHFSSVTRLTLDAEALKNYLEKNIEPAIKNLSGVPSTHEIEISQNTLPIRIKPCLVILDPKTILSHMRGKLNVDGVTVKNLS